MPATKYPGDTVNVDMLVRYRSSEDTSVELFRRIGQGDWVLFSTQPLTKSAELRDVGYMSAFVVPQIVAGSYPVAFEVRHPELVPSPSRSDTLTVLSPAPPVPGVPTNLTATGRVGSIALRWTANPAGDNVDFYEIDRTGAGIVQVFVNTFDDYRNIVGGQWYQYRIRAHNAAGYSGYTGTVNARALEPPAPPAVKGRIDEVSIWYTGLANWQTLVNGRRVPINTPLGFLGWWSNTGTQTFTGHVKLTVRTPTGGEFWPKATVNQDKVAGPGKGYAVQFANFNAWLAGTWNLKFELSERGGAVLNTYTITFVV